MPNLVRDFEENIKELLLYSSAFCGEYTLDVAYTEILFITHLLAHKKSQIGPPGSSRMSDLILCLLLFPKLS